MREIVFRVLTEHPGHLEAQAEELPIVISAPSLEELQHEAREALIQHLGAAHCTYRVRVRRRQSHAVSTILPLHRPPAHFDPEENLLLLPALPNDARSRPQPHRGTVPTP